MSKPYTGYFIGTVILLCRLNRLNTSTRILFVLYISICLVASLNYLHLLQYQLFSFCSFSFCEKVRKQSSRLRGAYSPSVSLLVKPSL